MDEIEVTVNVDNQGDYDLRKVEVSWGVYDRDTGKFIIDDTESDFKLSSGNDKDVTIKFKLDKNIDKLDSDLIFVVKATGEIRASDNPDLDKKTSGTSGFLEISPQIEGDFVILDNIVIDGEKATDNNNIEVFCGSTVQVSADVWNIGDGDQQEVSVDIDNEILKKSENMKIGDINAFDNSELIYEFKVPQTAKEGETYSLKFSVIDEYNDIYQNSNDDFSEYTIPVTVGGNCIVIPTAKVDSQNTNIIEGGVGGELLKVSTTVTNTGDELKTYNVSVSGYEKWAESAELNQNEITLAPGESTNISASFQTLVDAYGEEGFTLEIVSGKDITQQPISVELEKANLFKRMKGKLSWFTWVILAASIVLFVAIVVLLIRLMKKK